MPHTVSSYKSLLKFIQSFVICSLLTETKPSVECCGGSVIGVNPLKQSTAGGYARTRSKMTRLSAFLILIWTNNNDNINVCCNVSFACNCWGLIFEISPKNCVTFAAATASSEASLWNIGSGMSTPLLDTLSVSSSGICIVRITAKNIFPSVL